MDKIKLKEANKLRDKIKQQTTALTRIGKFSRPKPDIVSGDGREANIRLTQVQADEVKTLIVEYGQANLDRYTTAFEAL